jgi:hypothetical protein
VRGVLQLVDDAEFKRRQTPPGVKVTSRAFGQDLSVPIANAWRPFRADEAELVTPDAEAGPARWSEDAIPILEEPIGAGDAAPPDDETAIRAIPREAQPS